MAKGKGTSRTPDYDLAYLNKKTEANGKVGAGWKNANGTISVRLNVMVHLFADPDMVLTLFPKTTTPLGDSHEEPF